MAQTISRLVLRLKLILQKHDRLTTVAATLAQFLLFPLLGWVMLWSLTRLPAAFIGSTQLIATFFLPLLTLFVLYRVVSVVVLLMFEEDVHTALVQRFLFPLLLMCAVIQLIGLFTDLSLIGETQLFTIAKTTVTLRNLLIASVGLYLWFAGVGGLAQLLRKLLLDRLHIIDESALDGSLILFRYFLIGLGLFFAFSELNLDSTAVAAISGGLAVGIGFGLKDVVMNFLSGITLLFERSLRPGDIIEFNNKVGKVEEINLRATTIKTADHMEIVIPNQLFWTASLTSYTRRSRLTRFELEVPISYQHSPETITAIILNAVRENAKVSTSLTAKVEIGRFEPQRVVYKLRFWLDDNHLSITNIRSAIYRRIWQGFEEQGIDPTETVDVSLHNALPIATSDLPSFWTEAANLSSRRLEQAASADTVSKPQPSQSASPPPAFQPPKASAQVELLESSFEKIKPHATEFSASFYKNLFRTNPKLRSMFSNTDMEKQQQKLVSALVLLVANLRDPDLLAPMLRDLGARHKGYGVIEKHYPTIGAALLQTFEQYLRDDWTREVQQAWADTFEAIAQIMLEGAEELQ